MVQIIRKSKGESGIPNIGYRHTDGHVYPAQINSAAALATPAAPTVTPQGTTGGTTYSYRVAARSGSGTTVASTAGTTATGNATLTGSNFNRIVPATVTGAAAYDIYGRTSGSELYIGTLLASASPFQFDDTGTVTPAGALPAAANAFIYAIRVPSLRQGASGAANSSFTNVPANVSRNQTGVLVQGR